MWDRLGISDLPVHYEFIETPVFARRLGELASDETLEAIQSDLIENPERWPVVRGLQGARKGRAADPMSSRGKSGGFRYIYLYLQHAGRIYLLFLFGKNEQANLSPAQVKALGKVIAKIKEEALGGPQES
jgi:hypothetical protein